MAYPTVRDIEQKRDVLIEWLDDAISDVLDLGETPDEYLPAAERVAADRIRKADEMMGSLCRMLARWAELPSEDGCSLDSLEAALRWKADHPRQYSAIAERADYHHKLAAE